jgi:predicted PurR-regulated permease PerM
VVKPPGYCLDKPVNDVVARERVPVRTILTTIGLVLATIALLYAVIQIRQVLTWIVIAAFFAVALAPLVGFLEHHLPGQHRALATLLVFLLVLLVLIGIGALFAVPLATEGKNLAGQLPDLISQARDGRGPIGDLLRRTNALNYVQTHQDQIKSFASGLTTPAAGILRSIATGVAGAATIFVLAYLMVLEGPKIVDGGLNLFPPDRASRIRNVANDCARSVTGYISGNLVISVICGILTYIVLVVAGVEFAGLIAVFVAVVDLIPLVGATIGAVVGVAAAFIHSVPAGIALIVFFVIYQQVENHLLQPVVYARTVKLNPLTVIVAILVAVELAGILGSLLAIPLASMIQVILRDLWDHRAGRPKPEPTVGEDQTPALENG